MTSQTDARACVTNLAYDLLGRPTTKTYSNCPSTPTVTYGYDSGTNGIGRRTSMSVNGGDLTSWNYDIQGRVASENKQIPGAGQFVTSFTYNSAGLPKTMTYPDGEVVTINYNNNMQPISAAGTDTYVSSITYDSASRMTHLIRGAGILDTAYNYNAWNVQGGRLQSLSTTRPADSATLQNLTYAYDPVGNINTITDSLSGPQTQTFTYDALDRLINSNVTGGTDGLYSEGYTYNPATGNLDSKGSVTYSTYDSLHKHAVATLSNGNSYGYDANGNMTTRTVNGQNFTLSYDAENRLVSVSGAATASFVYDADGKQVKTVVDGVTTYYVGGHYEVKGSTVTKYYFAGSARVAVRKDGTLNYLLGDHLGSSSVTTNASGIKIAQVTYKAFGETRYSFGNLGTDYKFTGQREEASLGLYFYGARWFDPSLGRFISPDSIVPTQTQGTQAWDRYAYVNGNPVKYKDPTGHWMQNEDHTTIDNSTGKVTQCMNAAATNHRGPLPCNYPAAPTASPSQGNSSTATSPSWPWSSLPPINFRYQSGPVTIYDSNPNVFAVTITVQQSGTVSNGSPVTMRSDGQTILTGQGGNSATFVNVDGSHVTGFGVAGYDQVNDQVTQTTGVSLAPDTLNVGFSQGTVINIPNTGISIGSATHVNVGITYNPMTLATIGILSGLGAIALGIAAIAPIFGPAPVGIPLAP